MTNEDFGKAVGCSHSMASRLRAGKRLPSASLMERIGTVFGIPADEMLRAHKRGADSFGRLIRKYEKTKAKRVAA